MGPLRALAIAQMVRGPHVISCYNDTEAAPIIGKLADGVSSSAALAAMEELSDKALLRGFSFEWTSTAYLEKPA